MATRRAISGELLSRCMGDPDAVFQRLTALKKEGEHVVAELERFNREHPVHEVIGDVDNPFAHFTFADALVCGIVCFLIGWLLATGGVL